MRFKQGEFLKLMSGQVLEVIYADVEKAVCLKIKDCYQIGWIYTGDCIIVSNKSSDYEDTMGIEAVPDIVVTGSYRWEPLRPTLTFPMV